MAHCPSCGADILEDFGFVSCGQCGTMLVIDIDGNAKIPDAEDSTQVEDSAQVEDSTPPEESAELPPELPETVLFDQESLDSNDPPEDDFSSEADDFSEEDQEPDTDDSFEGSGEDFAVGEEEEPIDEQDGGGVDEFDPMAEDEEEDFSEPDGESSEDFAASEGEELEDFDEGSSSEDPVPAEDAEENVEFGDGQMDMDASPDFVAGGTDFAREIEDYGNSDVSQAKDGVLRFNLIIEGIDTPDIRTAIREALVDRKFIWDADEIISQTENGTLVIKDVTAVKATLVVKRIRNLPIEIRWEQYAINQS